MKGKRLAHRWRRPRSAFVAALGATLVLAAAVLLWWNLPRLVRAGLTRGAAAWGFTDVRADVVQADLGALRTRALHLQRGGLEISLDEGAVDYSLRRLLAGGVTRARVTGLTVQLDFARPRRGWLPDVITELLNELGPSEAPGFAWPVDELELRQARLVLITGQGRFELPLDGRTVRQADGQVEFSFESAGDLLAFQVQGRVRPETLDGTVELATATLKSERARALARGLGWAGLPPEIAVDADDLTFSGRATLHAGEVTEWQAAANLPRAEVEHASADVHLADLVAMLHQSSGGRLDGEVRLGVRAQDPAAAPAWRFGPTELRLSLDGNAAQVALAPADFSWSDQLRGRVGVQVRADPASPAAIADARAEATVDVAMLEFAGTALAPFQIRANGSRSRLELNVSEVTPAAEPSFAVRDFRATVQLPPDAAVAWEAHTALAALSPARRFLPAGVTLPGTDFPLRVAVLDAAGSVGDAGIAASLDLTANLPGARWARGESVLAGTPALTARLDYDAQGLAAAAALDLAGMELRSGVGLPEIDALNLAVELPRTGRAALEELLRGNLDRAGKLTAILRARIHQAGASAGIDLTVQHDGAAGTWTANAAGTAGELNGTLAGLQFTGLGGELKVDSGVWPDARLAGWWRDRNPATIVRELVPALAANGSFSAAALEMPDVFRLEWAGGSLEKPAENGGNGRLAAKVQTYAGILRTGPEVVEQPALTLDLTGTPEAGALRGGLTALLEGRELALETQADVRVDWGRPSVALNGTYRLAPFSLNSSDIVSRWVPAAAGLAVSFTAQADGSFAAASDGKWDGTAHVAVSDGVANLVAKELHVDGLFADITIDSLLNLRTAPGQELGFASLARSGLTAANGRVRFHTDGAKRLYVEEAAVDVLGGRVSTGPFSLFFPNPDVAVVLQMDDLDLALLSEKLAVFNGAMTGRVDGRLPLGLLAGRPIFGQGFLALDDRYPARFSYDVHGTFTRGLPEGPGVLTQVNRLPYELLEEGLGSLDVASFRADLFRRDLPQTPIRIQFAGRSATPRATVPFDITTNVNGTVREIIEFLVQALVL